MVFDAFNSIPDERALFLYSHIYLICAVLMIMVVPLFHRHFSVRINLGHKLFMLLIFLDLSILLIDWFGWMIYGKIFSGSIIIHNLTKTLFYLLDAFILFVWLLYCVFKLYRTKAAVRTRMPIYLSVFMCAVCIMITNPFTEWIFDIDSNNIYTRGDGYWLVFLYATVVLAIIITEVIIYQRKYGDSHDKGLYARLLVVPAVVTLARLVQTVVYGAALTWPIFTIGLLYTYMYMQANENYFDYLTGLRNRRELDYFFAYRLKTYKKTQIAFLAYFDLNDFKRINDTFGHPIGDSALVDAANLLRQASFDTDDFVARIGGDEFAVVGVRDSKDKINEFVTRVNTLADEFNSRNDTVYNISFSCGIACHEHGLTQEQMVEIADKQMYECKDRYRSNKNKA